MATRTRGAAARGRRPRRPGGSRREVHRRSCSPDSSWVLPRGSPPWSRFAVGLRAGRPRGVREGPPEHATRSTIDEVGAQVQQTIADVGAQVQETVTQGKAKAEAAGSERRRDDQQRRRGGDRRDRRDRARRERLGARAVAPPNPSRGSRGRTRRADAAISAPTATANDPSRSRSTRAPPAGFGRRPAATSRRPMLASSSSRPGERRPPAASLTLRGLIPIIVTRDYDRADTRVRRPRGATSRRADDRDARPRRRPARTVRVPRRHRLPRARRSAA